MKKISDLEKALGGRLESRDERTIPGVVEVKGVEVVYFSDNGVGNFKSQFRRLVNLVNPPNAKFGGVNERGCSISLPDGQVFHAIGYHGDVEGWRRDIEIGAARFGLLLARFIDGSLAVSDGRIFSLEELGIKFT
ncbi:MULTISPECIES: hypothetical protein [Pandoraea]|uniref:hypothetical protein n=1 Tax=Pandoraea TaxID=93217 RepID=UPI0009351437|nr:MULTISPECIES: hypothetical protein [Pandoraea]